MTSESEIKSDTGFWWLAQISPANIETEWFSPVQYLGKRASAICADLWRRPHGHLAHSPEDYRPVEAVIKSPDTKSEPLITLVFAFFVRNPVVTPSMSSL